MASIAELSTLADLFPTKKIYIAETSYPAQGDQQPEAEYEVRLSSISSHNLCWALAISSFCSITIDHWL